MTSEKTLYKMEKTHVSKEKAGKTLKEEKGGLYI